MATELPVETMEGEAHAHLARVESGLVHPLPSTYRARLLSGDEALPLPRATEEWIDTVEAFLAEWHPLGGRLVPVEHLGEGIFACLRLGAEGTEPVIAWDVAADLAEQPLVRLGRSWESYGAARAEGWDPLPLFRVPRDRRRLAVERDLGHALNAFERVAEWFHQRSTHQNRGEAYDHHTGGALPGPMDWKPQRFAVHDHLIGVVGYRFQPGPSRLEVAGFATRDHTNYARGSATAGLLVALLCEWAATGADTIRFVEPAGVRAGNTVRPAAMPYEVAVLAWLLGVELQPEEPVIGRDAAARLLLELTPLPAALRPRLQRAGGSLGRLCLAVHRQLWSGLEAGLLGAWFPDVESLFGEGIESAEQVRYLSMLAHARCAALIGFAQRSIQAQEEAAGRRGTLFLPILDEPLLAYAVAATANADVVWMPVERAAAEPERTAAGQPLVLVPVPDPARPDVVEWLQCAAAAAQRHVPGARVIGIVPHRAPIPSHPIPCALASADQNALDLDLAIEQRLSQLRRLRR
jgi:hypothetical protein